MNPDEITLSTPSKAFAFEKSARDLDKIKDPEVLRNAAKTYIKLYLKQQEVLSKL
jgi:hypothetical protein|tara:strand:+ start:280 stop:444 length:165 start_codon:yes stop_codon:yes gene_type:complete